MRDTIDELISEMADYGFITQEFSRMATKRLSTEDAKFICKSLANTLVAYYSPGAELFGTSLKGSNTVYRRSRLNGR
jgi:hypothetical protein